MNEAGSTTIEMISWLPLLLIIMAAIIQFGLYYNARNAVQAAAFEAARQATVSINPEQTAKNVASAYAGGTLPGWKEGSRLETRININGRGLPNEAIVVYVSYKTPLFMPGVLKIGKDGGLFKVSGTAEMQLEERP